MTNPATTIRIGTLANAKDGVAYLRKILPHGFESFELCFGWGFDLRHCDLGKLAAEVKTALAGSGAVIGALGCYGNPLLDTDDAKAIRETFAALIDRAADFGTDTVCGFTGALDGKSVPDAIPRFTEVWKPLVEKAGEKKVRIGFENCPMGGTWKSTRFNLAFCPDAWELLFAALPQPHLGLEWEPCHQMCQLIDPIPQLRQWVKRIVHLHGKDATILRDVVARNGIAGPQPFAFHRTPGFGDSNWTDIISELRRGGFTGSIDIEGWHDPVYRGELEMTGQVHGLKYLQNCRTTFVKNP
jgi:sugar phosphate isomerase/epimerase